MFKHFHSSGHPGTRGLVWYRKTDNGVVEDYRVSGVDYAPVDTASSPVNYSHDEPTAACVTPNHSFSDHFSGDANTDADTVRISQHYPTHQTTSAPASVEDDETLFEAPEREPISTPTQDVDGRVCGTGLKLMKSAVVVILQHLINDKLKESCPGCEVDHPSQLPHSCLFEPEIFFEKYSDDVTQISGANNDAVTIRYSKPHYASTTKTHINDIAIEVKADQNQQVKCSYGKVIAKLHFRPVKHPVRF
ncbi:hypothetical protein SRHO_G00100630 [Serrasalmus rhombeus]